MKKLKVQSEKLKVVGLFFALFFGFSVSADSEVINEVRVQTNTGGNIAREGQDVKEGEAKSYIYVENIVNGEAVDPIEIETEAERVEVKSEIKIEDNTAQVQREIEIDSEKEVKNYEIELENKEENKEAVKEESGVFQRWWQDFRKSFKSFFQKLFSIF